MKRDLFRCDYCEIQRFDSETQQYINLPFACGTLAEWKQHIKRPKHCLNIARNKNLEDNLVVECKLCKGIFTKEQYEKHKNRNIMLQWSSDPIYKECSCNNFVYNGKRFENLELLKVYAENRYENGRKKYEYIPKPKKIKSFADRGKAIVNHVEEKTKRKKNREPPVEEKKEQENPITMTIEDEFNKLNDVKDKHKDRNDSSLKPIWDDEDICCECGLYTNVWKEYPQEKLVRWEVKLCECDDSDSDHSDNEKII